MQSIPLALVQVKSETNANKWKSTISNVGTADSRIFPDYLPGNVPDGDPNLRSGVSNAVIHFNATQAVLMGYQYWQVFIVELNFGFDFNYVCRHINAP